MKKYRNQLMHTSFLLRMHTMMRKVLLPEAEWLEDVSARKFLGVAILCAVSMACYGLSIGWWRSPLMGFYVSIKMPLLIFCTLCCNALLNGLLALLFGTGLNFRQSLLALLLSNAIAGLILASISPVTLFLALNAPMPNDPHADVSHACALLIHTALIAYAGVVANLQLHRLLCSTAHTKKSATITLFAWLAGNAFLGFQISWLMRPFFGTPTLKVEFFREDAWHGTFYDCVWGTLVHLSRGYVFIAGLLLSLALFPLFLLVLFTILKSNKLRSL